MINEQELQNFITGYTSNNVLELDVRYPEGNYIREQYFIVNGYTVTESHFISYSQGWSEPEPVEASDVRTFLKILIQSVKNNIKFLDYGTPDQIKIWNQSKI